MLTYPITLRSICFCIFLCLANINFAQTEDPKQPSWSTYHTTEAAYALLDGWATAYPNLTKVYSIGQTLQGTQLKLIEITNKETGKAEDKPAYYYDGNIHSGELTAAEVALHFAWHVLTNYGKDPQITRLLDTRTLYIRPKFNPDGADIALTTPNHLRSTPRPYDEDMDGLLDEDPRTDLNGDALITQMRVKNPHGKWKISEEDSRLMVERAIDEYEGEFYDVYGEGIDEDGDGSFNEDGMGGIDMNRNFPRNWGLESEQKGAGPYPLSEPETQATIEFLNSHRNITGVFHGHTAGGFLFRLPSTTSWDNYNMADQRLIMEMSDKYEETTDQRAIPSYSNPRLHRHGTLISWSYWDFGVVGFVPEFWGWSKDYNEDGRKSELEALRWNDEDLDGKGFIDWRPFQHPQLGALEIGGWDTKFTRQNPPPQLLQEEIEKYVPWMLWLAEISPEVVMHEPIVTSLGNKLFKISVTVANHGYLPTNITERALEVKVAVPVRAMIELDQAELVSGEIRQSLGHLPGSRDADQPGDSMRTIAYVVKATGRNASVKLSIESQKGGNREIVVELK